MVWENLAHGVSAVRGQGVTGARLVSDTRCVPCTALWGWGCGMGREPLLCVQGHVLAEWQGARPCSWLRGCPRGGGNPVSGLGCCYPQFKGL